MLNSLKIKHFRALEDFSVAKLGRVNLIVGKNNSGKSTVLEALQIYARNGDLRLLSTLAKSHDEPSRLDREAMPHTRYDFPFASFFTGRVFPEGDEGIEIGELESSQLLSIEHGYYTEWEETISNETGEKISRQRLKRISKADSASAEESSLVDALFIKKGASQLGFFQLDGRISRRGLGGGVNAPYDLFRRQLDYKLAWRGGHLIAVPPHNTSRTCPACGHVSADNRRRQAQFACVACGYQNHADVVGAINVLERGHRLLACGESAQLGRSVKQEPAEAGQAQV